MGANPNTFGGIKQVWDDTYQLVHYKQPVYRAIADLKIAAKLQKGDTFHRDYVSTLVANDMGADGSYSTQALTDTDETLSINKAKEVSFYIKELDELQNQLPVRQKYATQAMNNLFLQIDADVLKTAYQGAASSVDNADLGGTALDGITVNEANVDQVFIAAMRKLQSQNIIVDVNTKFTGDVKQDKLSVMPVSIISPYVYAKILLQIAGKPGALGDNVAVNGHMGRYMGFELFVSNNTAWTGVLLLGTQPTDADTVTIGGVVLTFKTVLGVTAGNVLIGANAAAARVNLAALINTPGTTTANGVALSTADQNTLKNVTAVDDAATKVTITAAGKGYVAVSETLTAAADIWTAALQIQHCVFGVNNSISLVIQKTPYLRIKDAPSAKVGYDFITWTVYGLKVFKDQTYMLVDVKVRSDAFTT